MTPTPTPIQLLEKQLKCYKNFRDQHIEDIKTNAKYFHHSYIKQSRREINEWQKKIDRYEAAIAKLRIPVGKLVGTPAPVRKPTDLVDVLSGGRKMPKGKSMDELEEKYFGKKGTLKRDKYEKEVAAEIKKERNKQAKNKK